MDTYEGLQKIGSGTSRDVYDILNYNVPDIFSDYITDDVVVKKAKRRFGYESNRLEYKVWNNKDLDFICPVIDVLNHGEYLIMKKADVNSVSDKHVIDVLNSYRKEYDLYVYTDIWMKNIGLYEGRPVLIDYPYIEY